MHTMRGLSVVYYMFILFEIEKVLKFCFSGRKMLVKIIFPKVHSSVFTIPGLLNETLEYPQMLRGGNGKKSVIKSKVLPQLYCLWVA